MRLTVILPFLGLALGEIRGDTIGRLRQRNNAKPVEVIVLTESLCPYCEDFLSNELGPAFHNLGENVMNVTVIPFGNAKLNGTTREITCQHGVAECDANTYELCAIEMVKSARSYLPFLICNAKNLPAGYRDEPFPADYFQKCAETAGIWWEALSACHGTDSLAWQVNHKAYLATPDHPYVPYVLLNGEFADGSDLQSQICQIYKAQGGFSWNCIRDDDKSLPPATPLQTPDTHPAFHQ